MTKVNSGLLSAPISVGLYNLYMREL